MPLALRPALAALAVALAGCLPALPHVAPEPAAPAFDPVAFFDGRTDGVGTLRVRGRRPAAVAVESVGRRLPDGRLELRQLVALGDAPQEARTWVFEPLGPGRYAATLTDASGSVEATVDGPRLTIRYPMGGGLAMTQHLTRAPDGRSARNLATVRWRGLPVARLDETIRRRPRPEDRARAAPGAIPQLPAPVERGGR